MWRFSDLSIEWQKEENGFLRPHNAHRGCLNRSTMHTKHLHFTWSLTQSLPLYHVALPCTQNCSLPLLFSAPVCGRCHMALLPSFLGSELVGDHVACCHPAYFAAMLLVKGYWCFFICHLKIYFDPENMFLLRASSKPSWHVCMYQFASPLLHSFFYDEDYYDLGELSKLL